MMAPDLIHLFFGSLEKKNTKTLPGHLFFFKEHLLENVYFALCLSGGCLNVDCAPAGLIIIAFLISGLARWGKK